MRFSGPGLDLAQTGPVEIGSLRNHLNQYSSGCPVHLHFAPQHGGPPASRLVVDMDIG